MTERDIWGREPLTLYEKVGREIERSPENLMMTAKGQRIQDLFVLFYKGKPDVRGVGALLYEGEWINYGSKIYRVNTTLSEVELKKLIMEELQVTEKDFLVSRSTVDPRFV